MWKWGVQGGGACNGLLRADGGLGQRGGCTNGEGRAGVKEREASSTSHIRPWVKDDCVLSAELRG